MGEVLYRRHQERYIEVMTNQRFATARTETFPIRQAQQDAVDAAAVYYGNAIAKGVETPQLLWNAKMRFGKTFAAYQLAKKMRAEAACRELDGTIEWDDLKLDKISRKAEVFHKMNVDETQNFKWICDWAKTLTAVAEVLGKDKQLEMTSFLLQKNRCSACWVGTYFLLYNR